jgi:hypothetical protein
MLVSKKSLLTPAEFRFFGYLRKAVGRKYHISMKVRVADLIDYNPASWKVYGVKTSGIHADFVLLNPKDSSIVACIELDDDSHKSGKTYEKDKIKTAALLEAGIPLVRFPVKRIYDGRTIRKAIKAALIKS